MIMIYLVVPTQNNKNNCTMIVNTVYMHLVVVVIFYLKCKNFSLAKCEGVEIRYSTTKLWQTFVEVQCHKNLRYIVGKTKR